MASNLIVNSSYMHHPFKEGVGRIIDKHFTPSIADRFYCVLEVEKFNKKGKNIQKQLQDQVYVMEVYYTHKSGISQYICDLLSRWPPSYTEAQLLRFITDKYKALEIGKDWVEKDGKISEDITSGKYQTPDEEVLTEKI